MRPHFRKLRIAWSVAWSVVAVLLCVLWVRSYWQQESIVKHIRTYENVILVSSHTGRVIVEPYHVGLQLLSRPDRQLVRRYGWRIKPLAGLSTVETSRRAVPHWSLVLLALGIAATPW